jgi:hypothetical protein
MSTKSITTEEAVSSPEHHPALVPTGLKRLFRVGFWIGLFRKVHSTIDLKVASGYEDAAGFHFGQTPRTDKPDDTLSFGM